MRQDRDRDGIPEGLHMRPAYAALVASSTRSLLASGLPGRSERCGDATTARAARTVSAR